jgi:hypothetical protein
MVTQAAGIVFVNRAFNGIRFHQTYGAERQGDTMFEHATLKEIQFQAAAAEVKNQPRLEAVAQGPLYCGADQARLFFAADYFQFNSCFSLDAVHQFAVVAGLSRGGGGYSAIGGDLMSVHAVAELAEDSRGARNRIVIEQAASEGIVAQADSCSFVVQNLDMVGRSGAGNNEPNGIGARIDRG